MGGVETRSRLEQLQSVQRRTQHQIAIAHAKGDRHEVGRLQVLEERLDEAIVAEGGKPMRKPLPGGKPRTRRKKAEERVLKHLERLGVTSHDVKVWAVSVGLLDAVRRGRIKGVLVDAYEAAHQQRLAAAPFDSEIAPATSLDLSCSIPDDLPQNGAV